MDASNSVVSAVAIRNGRFAEIGRAEDLGRCSRTINLRGATVIPGLIDSHVHFIRDGLNPGHEVRIIETATIGDDPLTVSEARFRKRTPVLTLQGGRIVSGKLEQHRIG